MISDAQIHDIAEQVALRNLREHFKSVVSSSATDSMGRDAISIQFFLTPGSSASITGRIANDTVFELNKALQAAGEERLPMVRWFEKQVP